MKKNIVFDKEAKEVVFKVFEEALVENKYGEVKKLVLNENKKQMVFYDSSDNILLELNFGKEYNWIPLQVYVQSICDYYQRNLMQDKFIISFENSKEEGNIYI